MKEIEYKYLVDEKLWQEVEKPEPELIVQGFVSRTEDSVVRVRIKGAKGYLTIKGKTVGITRQEFEYEIPLNEAEEILKSFTSKEIRKHRYEIAIGKHIWEVDEFHGKLEGLVLAELEVSSEEEQFELPTWVTQNVSTNPEYYNAVLIDKC